MNKLFIAVCALTFSITSIGKVYADNTGKDTSEVISLTKQAYNNRLTSPDQTVTDATKALTAAQAIGSPKLVGEAYRVRGIGYYYSNKFNAAIGEYLNALSSFETAKDERSIAKVNNNIGNLYVDNNFNKALEYFQKALVIAEKITNKNLIASLYMNIGNVYLRKKSFNQALNYYNKSNMIFERLQDSTNLVQCLQNRGVVYYRLNQYDLAEKLLLQASKAAKERDLNKPVASINITLASLYIAKGMFDDAEKAVQEGTTYARLVKDEKLESDYNYTNYLLELRRKNYKQALHYLQVTFLQDSSRHTLTESTQMDSIRQQFSQQAKEKDTLLLIQRQEYDRTKFWAVTIVAGLLLVVVGLLISNVKRKEKNNAQLTGLNDEISKQKDNLDRINHHLEEIIDERTKDLQIKNKKLSEYSSYLSHQIRGPIATLRGLLNLEREGLVDKKECINMMEKCVSDIDHKIIETNETLNDNSRSLY